MIKERFELAVLRMEEIVNTKEYKSVGDEKLQAYFDVLFSWCMKLIKTYDAVGKRYNMPQAGGTQMSIQELSCENEDLYQDILPGHYEKSYASPVYAVSELGEGYGQVLSFLYVELRSQIESVYEQRLEELVIHLELVLEIYGVFYEDYIELQKVASIDKIKDIIYWFVSDYSEPMMERRVREQVDADCDFATRIIMESDLTDLRYLYRYGEYITENQIETAEFINNLDEATIAKMADTYVEGYRKGFELAGKPLERKKTVNIRYSLGFERVIRRAIEQFAKLGLRPTIYRASTNIFNKRGVLKIGYYGAIPNKQMEYDHKEDQALFMDSKYIQRKKEILKEAYEQVKELAKVHAGPACMEIFGEKQFEPVNHEETLKLDEKQRKLSIEYSAYSGEVVNEYIPGEERSFTIIAFPVPEIGEKFAEIFESTIKINTLDYEKYARIQAKLIEALDMSKEVRVIGKAPNQTDLTIQLITLNEPEKQTKFENCVADVNIPVGEVFTSPVLKGTKGILHVSKVFLEELEYRDLMITLEDGMIKEYSCANFATSAENKKYIADNILFHHPTLPIGEFAIGTNTTAYVAAKKYGIEDKLPILIAEKMGPHFAFGDTCYSHSEDIPVFNPDGKEIVARDNEVSVLRKTDAAKAYFNCHTDITIPYDELEALYGVKEDGTRISIIENARFVLEGCEELNEPFESEFF